MPKLAIVTDSTVSIPERLLQELKVNVVPYYIHRGNEVWRDLVTIDRETFYRWLPTAEQLPQTASPGPGDYIICTNNWQKKVWKKSSASI